MRKDLHLKKIYIAVVLTALTMLPTAFAIGAFLDNNIRAGKIASIANQQAQVASQGVHN